MAKPGAIYPQVEAGVASLMHRRVMEVPARGRVVDALRAAERPAADVVVVGARSAVRRRDLERAVRWGWGERRADELTWNGLPTVPMTAPEIVGRRWIIEGSPMVLVRSGRRVVGVIDADLVEIARPMASVAPELDRLDSREGEARLWLLRVAGKMAEGLGTPVFAVGGFVRDLLLGRAAPDVDLLVEGDGVAFARQLRDEIGGRVTVHDAFGTASIEGAAGPGGTALGPVDVATARRERYDAPGALPVVSAATVDEDLRRRDFSVNALALALQPSAFGRLLDPLGGRRDLRQRRLRPLSPTSFAEDPTRIFRAARYAARLGFRLDVAGLRAMGLALAVANYPALSGPRLRAELDLMAAEPRGWRGLALLLEWKALRLWDAEYEASERTVDLVGAGARLGRWARRVGVALHPSEVMLIALLADQRAPVIARCLARLAFQGEPARRVHAGATARPLVRRLGRAGWRRPSDIAATLDPYPAEVLAGAWLRGGPPARRRVEWFLRKGRNARPLLSGDEVVALGVPRGPAVGQCLGALRRFRLDRLVRTRRHERAFVRAWLAEHGRGTGTRPAGARRGSLTAGGREHARRRRARDGRARTGKEAVT